MFHEYEHALLGLMIMLFMIFLRQGILPGLASLLAGRRRGAPKPVAPAGASA